MSLQRLESLLAAADATAPLPREVLRWLREGAQAWLHGEPLEEALGLDRSERNTRQRALRDYHIREDWRIIAAENQELSPWKVSCMLKRQINRFETVIWSTWRYRDTPPEGASALRNHLFHAYKIGSVPGKERMIHAICCKISNVSDFTGVVV